MEPMVMVRRERGVVLPLPRSSATAEVTAFEAWCGGGLLAVLDLLALQLPDAHAVEVPQPAYAALVRLGLLVEAEPGRARFGAECGVRAPLRACGVTSGARLAVTARSGLAAGVAVL